MIAQSLWIGQSLTRMERACIQSWINAGYDFHLFSYDKVDNLPEQAVRRDAREILPENRIFQYKLPFHKGGGSYSGFSNFFRYKLLLSGGMWVDTDMYCLKPLPDLDYILVQEGDYVASCLLKVPSDSEFAQRCWSVCNAKNPEQIVWGETGPKLVLEVSHKLCLPIQPSSLYFPIMYWDIRRFLDDEPIPNAYTVHFWNEMWRRTGQDKNVTYRANSLYERLIAHASFARIF